MGNKYINCTLLYEDSVNNMNRVVRLEDGSLFTLGALKKNIYNIGSYPMHQYIFSRQSFDNGRSWTMPKPIIEFPDTRMFHDISQFMISRDGYLHVFMYRIWKYDFETNEFKGDIMHARMDDINDKNPKIQKIECLDRYTGSLNNLIQLESGRLLVPYSTLDEESGVFQSSTIYSDDEGLTWNVSNQVDVRSKETHVESGAVEPVVAEVEKNKIVMLIRTVLGRLYYSVSYDGGESWSESKKSNIKSSNAPAVIQKLEDGRFLVSWNNCNGMPMRGVRYSMARQCLHAAVSDDGLKTLKGVRMIVRKEETDPDNVLNCYPFSSLGKDDEIYIRLMTIQSKDGEKWPDPNSKLISLKPYWLEKTDMVNSFKNWICDIIPGNDTLVIQSKSDRPGYAAVNFPYGQKGSLEIGFGANEDISEVHLILSDNYMDISNFTLDKENEHYREYIDGNYVRFKVEPNLAEGNIKVMWDKDITVECNGKHRKVKNSFPGFNHLGILLPKGRIEIRDFSEESMNAWLDTGIQY